MYHLVRRSRIRFYNEPLLGSFVFVIRRAAHSGGSTGRDPAAHPSSHKSQTSKRCSSGRLPLRGNRFQCSRRGDGATVKCSREDLFDDGFDVEGFDERPYAREVSELYGTDHHELIVRPEAMEILPTLVSSFGEPFADNSAIPTFCVARMAREHVTVALNGDGGDESFGGYERYVKGRLADRLFARPRLVRRATRTLSLALGPGSGAGFQQQTGSTKTRAFAVAAPAERYEWRMAYFKPEERPSLYTEAFARQVEAVSTESPIVAAFDAAAAADEVNRLLDVDVQTCICPNAYSEDGHHVDGAFPRSEISASRS